jgi:hypothetical protein
VRKLWWGGGSDVLVRFSGLACGVAGNVRLLSPSLSVCFQCFPVPSRLLPAHPKLSCLLSWTVKASVWWFLVVRSSTKGSSSLSRTTVTPAVQRSCHPTDLTTAVPW